MSLWSRLFDEATDVADEEQCEGGLAKILLSLWCGVLCGSVAEPQTGLAELSACMFIEGHENRGETVLEQLGGYSINFINRLFRHLRNHL